MSRLVSALLVLAMLCAMVPTAFAQDWGRVDLKGIKDGNIYELWRGDTFELPENASCKGASRVTTFTTTAGTKLNNTSNYNNKTNACSYVSYSNGKYTASVSTLTDKIPNDYIIATVTCNDDTCAHTGATAYKLRIYEKATKLSGKLPNGTTITESNTASNPATVVVTDQNDISNPLCIDITITPEATAKNNVDIENLSAVKAVEATYNSATKQVEIVYEAKADNILKLTADAGTDHERCMYIRVTTSVGNTVVSIKKGNTVVATTGDKDKGETVTKGTKMTLTATVSGSTGVTNNVIWSSSDSNTVFVNPYTGAVEANAVDNGTIITATSVDVPSASASYTINVIDAITGITLKENNKEVTSKDTTKSATPFTIAAVTAPTGSESSIKWSVSDANVLNINVEGNNYDANTKTVTGASVKVVPANPGKATLTATIGGKSKSVTITVWEAAKKIVDYTKRSDYTIRDGSDIAGRFQKKYPTVLAELETGSSVEVPVTWTYAKYSSDKKTVTVEGYLNASNSSEYAQYEFMIGGIEGNDRVTATATLTNDGEVTSNIITASSTNAVEGDKITFTCTAKVDPSDCKLAYQWYKDGTPISGATSSTYTFTVPESSKDSSDTYKFTCNVTATRNNTTSAPLESNTVTLNVSRDYAIELTADSSNAAYTVGQTPKVTATVYKYDNGKKTTVSNPGSMSWELLDTSTGKAIDSKIATISGSGNSATVTTKATGKADGQKITVQVTVRLDGYIYSGKKDITLSAASAGAIKMSVGAGATIKSTTVQSKAKDAVKSSSNVTLSYVKFGTPKNCTLTKSSGSSSAIGSTACYFSTTSGQKLSDVYVTLANGASTGSVSYTVYDNNDNTVATGTINFDSSSTGSITCLGIDFSDAEAVEMIAEEFPEAEYVKFNALDVKYGRLLLGYKGIVEIDSAKDVKDSDKYYLKNSSSVDGVEELYLLPRTDYYGAINISYTAYSSSKALGEGTLTFTVVRKTASSKFTDVTSANVGSWAADAIDFMADNSLVGGVGNNKFNPTGTMTRCDLVLIMYRMAGQPSVTGVENPFTDVNTNDYFYKAVLWAYKNGVVNGTGADTFSPKKNITREQIASILFRYSGATTASGSLTSFTDAGSVSDYATTAMKWAVGAGIIGGSNGKLDPQGNATRAQVAVMLHRFLNK